jgi:hypothetical protein
MRAEGRGMNLKHCSSFLFRAETEKVYGKTVGQTLVCRLCYLFVQAGGKLKFSVLSIFICSSF